MAKKYRIKSKIGATDLIDIFSKELGGYSTSDFTREIIFISFVVLSAKLDRTKIKIINFPNDDKYNELLECNNSLNVLIDMQHHFLNNNKHYKIFFDNLDFIRYAKIDYNNITTNIFKLLKNYDTEYILKNGFFNDLYQDLMTYGTQQALNSFYTPLSVATVMAQILNYNNSNTTKKFNDIVDCCCGCGNLLLSSLIEELKNNNNYSYNTYWCNDIDFKALNTCVFNLILNGAKGVFWRLGDGLDDYTKNDFNGLVYYTKEELVLKLTEYLKEQKAI